MNDFPLLSEAMKDLASVRKEADFDVRSAPVHLQHGLGLRKNAAAQKVLELERTVQRIVMLDAAAMFVLGSAEDQRTFADIAEDEASAIVFDVNAMYLDLAKFIFPRLDSKDSTFNSNAGQAFLVGLTTIGERLKLYSVNMPRLDTVSGHIYRTPEALAEMVKEKLRAANGDGLNAAYITQSIADKVVAEEYGQSVIPVVIVGATEDEAKGELAALLFEGRTQVVEVSNPEKNDVVVALKAQRPLFKRVAAIVAAKKKAASKAAPTAGEVSATTPESA